MSTSKELIEKINAGAYDSVLHELYGEAIAPQKERYANAIKHFVSLFGEQEGICVFSSPGRTEIGGNHVDHNHGKVLAGSVNLDVIAVAAKTEDSYARVHSDKFAPDHIDMNDQGKDENEIGHSSAMIRGIANRFDAKGYRRGGFCAYTTSNVPKGSGVSSSAAFEVLLCSILNFFYNEGKIPAIEIAKISQFAEREYFGKPCGLMDQAACALGGICEIDFADEENPRVSRVPFRFADSGYKLCLVAVGGDHSDLTDCYAALPQRMRDVAAFFGKPFLNEITLAQLWENLAAVRKATGDDAVLAALHFVEETERVPLEREALASGNFAEFLQLVTESGHSSYEYLQNVLVPKPGAEQGAAIALNLASTLLRGKGAWRIHGGGFGGTTQNFVPDELVPAFRTGIERVFGPGSCHILTIRPVGPVQVM